MLRRAQISRPSAPTDDRFAALKVWLQGIEAVTGCEPTPASADASFRRYFRLQSGPKSFIAMDAPPPQENCLPFVRVAGYLESMRLNAPRVIEASLEDGFLLLSDLGNTQYLEQLSISPDSSSTLYADALTALLQMQERGAAFQAALPPYDVDLLKVELSLFHDWLCEKHLGIRFSESEESEWKSVCNLLINNALDQTQVFVHRDFHSRNLMVTDDNNPGILDFQDAVEGPITYDLVSLLKDCYIRWPIEQVNEWVRGFYSRLDVSTRQRVSEPLFTRHFDLMGVQRHLKAAGIFARLNHRDGKAAYLADVPRTLQHIVDLGPNYDELDFLLRLVSERCLPALRDAT